jgi:REP element-mobilizing transposase RayT
MDSSLFAHRGHALRKGRVSEAGRAYVLTTITHQRQPVFNDWRLARLLIVEMRRLHDAKAVESLAWVIMPDHIHWLLVLGDLPLQVLMQQLKSRSAIAINKSHLARHKRLWQKGFHDHALRREEDLQAAARYVVANPLRAGLVRRLADYPLWDATWL